MKPIKLKLGVNLAGVRPEIAIAIQIVHSVFSVYGYQLVITSVRDGNHMSGSLHYVGLAFDVRKEFQFPMGFLDNLVECLGPQYDVVDEGDHLHIEFQPKENL